MRALVIKMLGALIALLDRLTPASRGVVLTSLPDIEDNVVALLRHERATDLPITVLAVDIDAARSRARALGMEVPIVALNSLHGIWTYVRASVCVSTHGVVYGSRPRPRGKLHLGLWHGEYTKAVGRVAGEPTHRFDRMYVSGELSRLIRSAETGIHPRRIAVTGVPRTDLLNSAQRSPRPVIMWAPTYRASAVNSRRQDGDAETFQRFVEQVLDGLEDTLIEHDAEIWLRLHPSSAAQVEVRSSRVVAADDAFLATRGLTLYSALGSSHALITDYSSVWVDYLQLDRPVICAAPDLDEYAASRGLLLQPYEWWFPGAVCRSVDEVASALRNVLDGRDDHREHRQLITSILVSPEATRPTESLWRDILGG